MEGDLSLLSIPDLLQMICLGGYSRDIHLFDGQTQVGVIAIRNGRVDRCFGYGTWGEAAFYKLVNMRRGRYKVNEAQDMSASDATLTAYSWQELLMEAARQQDEAARQQQTAAANAGRVIPFPTPQHASSGSSGSSGFEGATMRDSSSSGIGELNFDFGPAFDGPSPSGGSGLTSLQSTPSVASPPSPSSNTSGSGLFSLVSAPPPPSSTTLPNPPPPPRTNLPRSASDTGRHEPVGRRAATDTGSFEPVSRRPGTDTGRHDAVGRRPASDTGRQDAVGRRPASDTGRHTLPVPPQPTLPASAAPVTSLITAATSPTAIPAPAPAPQAALPAAPTSSGSISGTHTIPTLAAELTAPATVSASAVTAAVASPPEAPPAPAITPPAPPIAPPTRAASQTIPPPTASAVAAIPEPILAVASGPIIIPSPTSTDSTTDDVMNLLQEATACYLRRDLARAEALLQKCLELRPGDKRALQNLDRIRRKKPQ